MRYTINDFRKDFPNDDTCLEYIFKAKYPKLKGYYRLRSRKSYCNSKGHQIFPLVGTIFERSRTPLTLWFYALYLFSQSKHGLSAMELQRQLGVTYKAAFRMGHQIRSLMTQDTDKLFGVVEADETYIGGLRKLSSWRRKKVPVMGIVQRGGQVRAIATKSRREDAIIPFIEKNIRKRSILYTDGAPVYDTMKGYHRGVVYHSYGEYVRGDIHTNSIEGFWSHLKRSLKGTYLGVSKQHLQKYINEAAFYYNHRSLPVFAALLSRI